MCIVSMPCFFARSRMNAFSLSEATKTISAFSSKRSIASIIACRSVPLVEPSTPIFSLCISDSFNLPACFYSVLHQRGNRHRPHAARDRRNPSGFFPHVFKVNVSAKLAAPHFCGADINHYRAFLHHSGLHELRLSGGGNKNVGFF